MASNDIGASKDISSTADGLQKRSVAEVERPSVDLEKPTVHSERVDKELAAYASDVRVNISPERNVELRRMIDKRVLAVMIATYFLQAIDKGTLSFSSIMGLPKDTGMVDANDKVTQSVSLLCKISLRKLSNTTSSTRG